MESPIRRIRRQLDLTRRDFAAAAVENYNYVLQMERGEVRLSQRVCDALAALGVDVDLFVAEHDAFRADRRKAIIKRARKRNGAKALISEAGAGAKS